MKYDNRRIQAFVERWTGKGYEKGESQKFWLDLLENVLGVENPFEVITFEDQVKLDHTSFNKNSLKVWLFHLFFVFLSDKL